MSFTALTEHIPWYNRHSFFFCSIIVQQTPVNLNLMTQSKEKHKKPHLAYDTLNQSHFVRNL